MNELFYVGIKDPVELRKELLTSSKDIIDSLKRYENYKDLKEKKTEHITELKHVVDELLVLNKKLRGKMPKVPGKMPEIKEDRTPKARPSRAKTKLDVLEEELSKIEKRLGSLE